MDDVALDVEAEDVLGLVIGVLGRGGEFDAASLAAAADLDLSLDDHETANAFGCLHGVLRRVHDLTGLRGHAVQREQVLRLIFVEIHRGVS